VESQKPRHLTIMIMPDTTGGEVRRLRVARSWLTTGLAVAIGMLTITVASVVYGVYSHQQSRTNGKLRDENQALRSELQAMDLRLSQAGKTVQSLKDYERRLRSLTMVHDPARNLAIGPVGTNVERDELDSVNAGQLRQALLSAAEVQESVELMSTRLENLEVEGLRINDRVDSLSTFLEGQRTRLASTPSRRPGPGYVSSTFGMRVDPFTGLPQFHSGLDFAANVGARVVSTADGTVIKAGPNGAYGNTVQVDHGHGLSTLYAHLSRVNVRVGDKVRRGDLVGAVGNTGRSTGPHLHYEVKLNGIPQDPSRFILE
jgi:murein DD-endopeptidase MepM/ murein hydrolase activator NlpD